MANFSIFWGARAPLPPLFRRLCNVCYINISKRLLATENGELVCGCLSKYTTVFKEQDKDRTGQEKKHQRKTRQGQDRNHQRKNKTILLTTSLLWYNLSRQRQDTRKE